MKQALVPVEAAQTMGLSMPLEPEVWIADRKQRLGNGLHRLALTVKNGTLPGGIIEDGRLRVERLEADVPAEADNLILDLYRRLNEAPYILDGLLMHPTGKRIKEQYADTGGFTDLVFAATSLLGYLFIPRIRDLPPKRLHVCDRGSVPAELRGLVGDKIRENTIIANWPDVLRCIATMLSPSHLLKKLAARPRQHDLAVALREIGRIERNLFIIEWLLDTDMQRRANIGLNKGEAHHALKNALRIGRQGEIRDRTTKDQHFRIAGLNLLTAIIIYWNTKQLGMAVAQREKAGLETPAYLLTNISPLGWAHIILTSEYRWRQMGAEIA